MDGGAASRMGRGAGGAWVVAEFGDAVDIYVTSAPNAGKIVGVGADRAGRVGYRPGYLGIWIRLSTLTSL